MSRGDRWMGRGRLAAGIVAVVALASCAVLPVTMGSGSTAAAAAGGGGHAPFLGFTDAPPTGPGASVSLDWAGYAVTGTPVTSVAGSWTQPSAQCPTNKVQQSAFWVGIDGYAATDPTVQQVGTDSDCLKASKKVPGGPAYYAWYEMYPGALVVLNPANYPVAPGNGLSASVVVVGTSYDLSITDAGRWSFTTTQPGGSPLPLNSSAEWIAEAPVACTGSKCKALSLADFTSVTFTGATVDGQAVDAAGHTVNKIDMSKTKKGTPVKASTSALDATGHVFTVTWVSN